MIDIDSIPLQLLPDDCVDPVDPLELLSYLEPSENAESAGQDPSTLGSLDVTHSSSPNPDPDDILARLVDLVDEKTLL